MGREAQLLGVEAGRLIYCPRHRRSHLRRKSILDFLAIASAPHLAWQETRRNVLLLEITGLPQFARALGVAPSQAEWPRVLSVSMVACRSVLPLEFMRCLAPYRALA